jgi:hypothetical protein
MKLLFVLIIVLLFLISDIAFFVWWIRRLRAEAVSDLQETVSGEKVYHVEDCNYFGLQSAGYKQWRGNGVLALTGRGIHFRMFVPRKTLFIPVEAVREISDPRGFLGRTKAKKLLRVDFMDSAGKEDACAWLVSSLQWWMDALRALRSGEEPPAAPWKNPSGGGKGRV